MAGLSRRTWRRQAVSKSSQQGDPGACQASPKLCGLWHIIMPLLHHIHWSKLMHISLPIVNKRSRLLMGCSHGEKCMTWKNIYTALDLLQRVPLHHVSFSKHTLGLLISLDNWSVAENTKVLWDILNCKMTEKLRHSLH